MPRVLFLAQGVSIPELGAERTIDFRHAVDRTREAYFDCMLIEVGPSVTGGPLALLDQFLDLRHRDLDRERRFRRDRILAVLPEMSNHQQDAILFELGRRRIGGWLTAPDAAAVTRRVGELVRPPASKKALCAAGGGITGVYYELGVLRCLEDAFRGFSVHD